MLLEKVLCLSKSLLYLCKVFNGRLEVGGTVCTGSSGVHLLGCTLLHCCSERRFYYLRTEDKWGAAKSNK